jgi:hypothetical protein
MGLFSGSKQVYVSSSVYNLSGDEIDRPNYLKTNVFSAVTNGSNNYLGETIISSYLNGPGIMQRSFFNWSVNNDIAGLPTLLVEDNVSLPQATVVPFIPIPVSPVGLVNVVQSVELTDGDYEYWAEKWLFENDPAELSNLWISDYDSTTHTIAIQYADGNVVNIPATDYSSVEKFIIARYYQTIPEVIETLNQGTKTTGVYSRPNTTGYTLDSTVNTGVVSYSLDQDIDVVKEYSDGSPTITEPTDSVTISESFNGILETWVKSEYVGSTSAADDTSTVQSWIYIWTYREIYVDGVGTTDVVVNDLGGGDTETVTTTTTGDFIREVIDHQYDNQETILEKVAGNKGIWIYQVGSGNAILDVAVESVSVVSNPGYYPFIPLRLDNKSITEPAYDDITGSGLFKESKKAYKRATGGPMKGKSIEDILTQVEDNPSIGDVDYAYIQWGVSVNAIDPACRRYMYKWFQNMIGYQSTSATSMTDFTTSVNTYDAMYAASQTWLAAQYYDPNDPLSVKDPLFGTPKPPTPTIVEPPRSTVRLVSDHPDLLGFDNRFTWVSIIETNHTGLGKLDAVDGDIWFENSDALTWTIKTGTFTRDTFDTSYVIPRSLDQMTLFKQTSASTYSKLTIWGMVHENFIYGGKSVRTTLKDGVADVDESVFIIPLHNPTVKSLGIKDFTQLSLSNTFITFNSYQVVKQKWYESFVVMLIVMIVIIVLVALFAPITLGAAPGLLGTNAAVGTAVGLTGVSAAIAGAAINAVAGVILAMVITEVATSIFGEKLGAIIGAIVSFAITYGISSGGSFSVAANNLLDAQTLLSITSAIANGYSGYVKAEGLEIQADMEDAQNVYDKAVEGIEELMRSMGLYNDLLFNPLSLTDSVKGNSKKTNGSYVPETVDQFIGRTTMSGSEIADITLSMVSNYSEFQLTLPKT